MLHVMYYLSLLASGLVITGLLTSNIAWTPLWAQTNGPTLTIPQALPAQVDQPVTIPIRFHSGGAGVGSNDCANVGTNTCRCHPHSHSPFIHCERHCERQPADKDAAGP